MPALNLPLSGDVSQVINPWNLFIRSLDSQFGCVNINLGQSSDPEMEKQILADVGSYGRQLGQLGDALLVLVDRLAESDLNEKDKEAIRAFRDQMHQIQRIKNRKKSAA